MGVAIVGFVLSISSTAVMAGAVTSIVAGVITGALVGAAIGGISAAVMGGDIGKGMLYGAVGGAVTGGFSAWLKGPTALVEGGTVAAQAPSGVHEGMVPIKQTVEGGVVTGTTYGPPPVAPTEFMGMSGDMLQAVGTTVGGAAQGLLGAPEGIDYAAQTAAQKELNQQQIDAQAREAELARGGRMAELSLQLGTQLEQSQAALGEQRRQYDVTAATAAARQEEAATGRGMLTIGQEDEELDNRLYTNVAGVA